MKKIYLLLCFLILTYSIGCESGSDSSDDGGSNDQSNSSNSNKGGSSKKKKTGLPDWVLSPPTSDDKIYAVGIAQKKNLQLAMTAAQNRARDELARSIRVKVSSLVTDFMEETTTGKKSQITEFSQSVSKSVTSLFLQNSIVEESTRDDSTDPSTFFVLMSLPMSEMDNALNSALRENEEGFNILDSEASLEDLANEIRTNLIPDYFPTKRTFDDEKVEDTYHKRVEEVREEKVTKVDIEEDEEPGWVRNFPTSSEYYIGIGNGNSLQQAQDGAIAMLVSQIKVKVQSEVRDYMKETNGLTEEEVEHSIKLTVKESIEDLEFVGAYKDPNYKFWAYYRLNIAEYKRKQQEKMENAKRNALDFLVKSDEEEDASLKLKYALLGYFHIGKYVTQALRVTYKGQKVILINELTSRIQKVFSMIQITPLSGKISIEKISPVSQEVKFKVTVSGKPLANFPVLFINNKGELEMSTYSVTDSQGNVSCIVDKAVAKEEVQSFIVMPDVINFLSGNYDEDTANLYVKKIQALGFPSKEVLVNVIPPVFTFEMLVEDDLAGNRNYQNRLNAMAADFKNGFEKQSGAKFTNRSSKYKIQMTVSGTIRESSQSGQIFTRMTLTIGIIDTESNKEIFSKSTREIKGGSTTNEKSVQKSIDTYLKKYNDKFVNEIADFIESN